MPTVTVIDATGIAHRHHVENGEPLMKSLCEHGLVDAICGGGMSCGTCAVSLEAMAGARLPAADELELALLEGLDFDPATHRLSCQIVVSDAIDGMLLRVAPEPA